MDWELKKIKDYFAIGLRNGLTKPSKIRGAGIPMINMKEIFGYDVITDNTPMERVPVTDKEIESSSLEEDDLLFARQSLVESGAGKISIFTGKNPTVFESHLIRCRIDKKKACPKFIYYLFKSPIGIGTVSTIVHQVAAAGIKGSDLQELEFKFPQLTEQKAIASVLNSLDGKIDLLHRQNKTLENMAETIFRQWFIEEAQEYWRTGNLPEEFEFIMGQSPPGSSFNENGVGVPMFQGNADFGFRFPNERVYTTDPTRFAKKFDTLISVRAPVGAQNMALDDCCIGRGVAAFRYKLIKDGYTYAYFKLRSLMVEIKKFDDEGTVFGSISKSDFESLEVVIPPLSLVEDFEKTAKPINDKIIQNCFQIKTLEKLRDTLLPKLMSGEVRVTV